MLEQLGKTILGFNNSKWVTNNWTNNLPVFLAFLVKVTYFCIEIIKKQGKMNIKIIVLALLMLVILSCKVGAQTVIYGNVGVENVNISVRNSTVGTSSDAKGDYTLRLSGLSGAMQLRYSCIGYVDTIVSLSSRQMLHDSIRISFVMRKQNYSLEEVGILAKRNTRFEGDRHFIMDFEIYDGVIGILETDHNRKRFRIILADEDLIGFDTIIISSGITPTGLLRDCLGNCQMTTADSVYEINLAKPHKVIAVSRKEYNKVMLGCQFVTDQHIYIKEESMMGYYISFYRIDRFSKKPQALFVSNASDNRRLYLEEMEFDQTHSVAHSAPPGVHSRYIKKHWYRPSNAQLVLADNTLIYFDHTEGNIRQYTMGLQKIDSCAIDYPFTEGWKPLFYQDLKLNRFYTVINNQLFEIDVKTGKVYAKTSLNSNIFKKIAIYNQHLFVLRRLTDSSGALKTYIERREI